MNKKISVFILLILLASSFKYRAKSVESTTKQSLMPSTATGVTEPKVKEAKFEDFVAELQKANQELVSGNPEPFKALWTEQHEMNALGVSVPEQVKAVQIKLNDKENPSSSVGEYAYENVTTEVGSDLAYLVQTEHYRKQGEKPVDIQVTIVCRKEKEGWKIVHRQADEIRTK